MPPAEPLHPEDLDRKKLDREIPTRPPEVAPGDEKKIVSDDDVVHVNDYNAPPPEGGRKSTGEPLDAVGGPGLGLPPNEEGTAAAQRDRDVRAESEPARPDGGKQ